MKRYRRAGLLILTLAIPALILIFLKGFTTNHYVLPYFNPILDDQGRVVRRGDDTLFSSREQLMVDALDSSGLLSIPLKNRFTVVGFLPKDCDDRCTLYLEGLQRIYKLRQAVPTLSLVTLTDGAELLKVGNTYGMGSDGWSLYGLDTSDSTRAISRELNIYKNAAGTKTNYSFSRLLLLDSEGYTRGYYDFNDAEEVDRLMAEIRILDYELKHRNN
ncbi:protein SCO1/2 [Dyadobacter jejuensis]|uniref:Protein SCO1/2 n=1 Tax=Dyadobacter jejuensis TaxID=1082580 RepID=A0A316ASE2_9BACT|nr:hypothetical protein [Dyadobacter jejuensis]PWJ60164.1 protein SCO1/2 [Dyadobacter jejuensis]